MSRLRITDNHEAVEITHESDSRYWHDEIADNTRAELYQIANVQIKNLEIEDRPNLLVFPRDLGYYGDDVGEGQIISFHDDCIATSNIMGFVGVNDTQVDITSRFAKTDGEDYFLHYMLQRVFAINLFDIKHTTSHQPIFDFLLYLFPFFLKKALRQGVYKKYRRFEYNDSNIRGPIDVNRHIRENIPFRGTVAYSTREHTYDNEVTELIRHTIEYIKTHPIGNNVLACDQETKNAVMAMLQATPSYNTRERNRIINLNLRPVTHPYYSEYTALQKICVQILRHESIKYGQDKDKIYGVLFDGAWLWEEYLNTTILEKCGFSHPENKKMKGGFPMFEKADIDKEVTAYSQTLYPDFYKDNFIVDAKYKHLNGGVGREDLYQVVTYMYCRKAQNGGYAYPDEKKSEYRKHQLKGYNGYIYLMPFYVPQSTESYKLFIEEIKKSEDNMSNNIMKIQQ